MAGYKMRANADEVEGSTTCDEKHKQFPVLEKHLLGCEAVGHVLFLPHCVLCENSFRYVGIFGLSAGGGGKYVSEKLGRNNEQV